MTKIFKISLIFIAIITVFTCISHANTTNIYNDVLHQTTSETASNSSENETTLDEDSEPNNASAPYDTAFYSSNQNARVSTVSSIPEANLGLNNVLCIILIAIGILIILLAIAILIRLNR